MSAQWQGPLPPPGALAQFDQIIPNGAERIMVMCEKEQAARIDSERRISKAEIFIEGGGRLVGVILVLSCIAAAVWSITAGADWKVTLGFLSVPVMGAAAKLFDRSGQRKP
jgi:uncharacterized membrane protein